jgi:hypothetical protein
MGMSRVMAVGGLLVGAVALFFAVASGLRSVETAAAGCAGGVPRDEIRYSGAPYALHGVAGCDVRAVIARLNGGGAVWAVPHNGVFDTRVPDGLRVRAVVKVLSDGSRQRFAVRVGR